MIDSPTPKTDQDRLNIIAHDRFQDIIDDANRADSPIKLKTLILEAPGADDERLQSLWNYRQFYLEFPILSTAWRELSWSHFRMLLRVKGRGNHQNTFVIARPQAVAIHRPQSAAMDCRAMLAMTKVNDWHVCNFLLPKFHKFWDELAPDKLAGATGATFRISG